MKMKKLNKKQIEQICREYQKGKSIRKVGKIFGVSFATTLYWLKKKKIKRRPRLRYCRKLTLREKKEICKKYKRGGNISHLAREYKNPSYKIRSILVGENIKIRKSGTHYIFNENYFDELLDEHRTYWVGFIMADGCVYKNTLQFNIHRKDRTHLEKFKKDIQSNHIIYHIRNACRLMITSKKLCDSLTKFNIVPRKSLIAKTPTNIPNNLMRHFWRGVFDGDGSLYFIKDKRKRKTKICKRKYWGLNLAGTEDIVKNFVKFIKEDLRFAKVRKICYCMTQSSFEIFNITNLLYKDTAIYLNRKYRKYQDCLQSIKESKNKI